MEIEWERSKKDCAELTIGGFLAQSMEAMCSSGQEVTGVIDGEHHNWPVKDLCFQDSGRIVSGGDPDEPASRVSGFLTVPCLWALGSIPNCLLGTRRATVS